MSLDWKKRYGGLEPLTLAAILGYTHKNVSRQLKTWMEFRMATRLEKNLTVINIWKTMVWKENKENNWIFVLILVRERKKRKQTGIKDIENSTVIRPQIQKDLPYILELPLNVCLEKSISWITFQWQCNTL